MDHDEEPDPLIEARERKLDEWRKKLAGLDVRYHDYYPIEFALDNVEKIYRNRELIKLLG